MPSFTIKNPYNTKLIIVMAIYPILLGNMLIRGVRSSGFDAFFYVGMVLLFTFLTLLVFLIIKRFEKASEIQFADHVITIHGHVLTADMVDRIFVKGYFNPVIGIKPKGKRIVPMYLCFRFLGNEDKAMKSLNEWAEHNQIAISNKTFMRWA